MSSWLLLSLFAAPTPTVTADQAMDNYRETFSAVQPPRCAVPERSDELVVCGRRSSDERLPLPAEREAGEPIRLVAGESPRADAGTTGGYCFSRCPGTVGLDLGTAAKIISGLRQVIEGDD